MLSSDLDVMPRPPSLSSYPSLRPIEIALSSLTATPTRVESPLTIRRYGLRRPHGVAPFSKHRCCLGCVSLRDAIPLICVTQFILLAMASVIVLDIYISDGFLFYTRALEGRGRQVAQAFLFVVVVSFALHFLTILAWKHGRPRLYLLQAVWQLFLVGILVYILAQVAYAMHFSPPRILFASGCVISIFFSVVILLELWWAFVMVDAAFFEGFYYGRPSSRGDNDDDDCKADSRHIVLPVVTVDCVSE